MLADFHTHSHYSDGMLSPKELMYHAKEIGLDIIALTDHDTIAGIKEAQEEALKLGIKFISGVELSTFDDENISMHVLGLNIKNLSAFDDILLEQQILRKERNIKLLNLLKADCGIDINYEDIKKECKGTIGKGNISQYLVHHGYYPTYKDANKVVMQYKHLSCGIDVKIAIDIIHKAGGLAFLAHPHSLKLDDEQIERQIVKLQSWGLDGVEYAHSYHTLEQTLLYKKIADKYGLKLTFGSDFHGAYKESVKLAYGKSDTPLGDVSLVYLANK